MSAFPRHATLATASRGPLCAALVGALLAASACSERAQPAQGAGTVLDPEPVQMITDPIRIQAVNLGKRARADLSVEATTLFGPDDPIIAAVSTVGRSDAATLRVRLVYRDGVAYADLKQTVRAEGPRITAFRFPRDTPWPIGRYVAEVSLDGKQQVRQSIEVLERAPVR